MFDTDNEGAYRFVANSFAEFYESWLNGIADAEGFRKELEEHKRRFGRRNFKKK